MSRRSASGVFACAVALSCGVAHGAGFTLGSPSARPGAKLPDTHVFNGFGCSGKNLSPALKWSGAPKDTKSFALTVYDPDAPTGSGWWHWVVLNLPATTTELPEGGGSADAKGLPAGAMQVRNDYGTAAFGGACPPQGDKPHRYIFTVYALKTDKLDVPADATAALAGFMINANKIGSATFTSKYSH